MLDELRARGLKLGLLSNTGRDLDVFVSHHGIEVDAILTSRIHGKAKPHETIFRAMLEKLAVALPLRSWSATTQTMTSRERMRSACRHGSSTARAGFGALASPHRPARASRGARSGARIRLDAGLGYLGDPCGPACARRAGDSRPFLPRASRPRDAARADRVVFRARMGAGARVHRQCTRVTRDPAPDRESTPEDAGDHPHRHSGAHRCTGARARASRRQRRRVRIGGEEWSARAYMEDQVLEPGARVEVAKIEGATALVYE